MNVFALFSFISFILFLQAGVFMLYKNSRPLLNRVFILLSFLFALYALSYNLFFGAETLDEVYFYDRIASPGWIFFPIVSVWFAILLANNKSYVIRFICYFFLLPVALFSLYVALTDLESVKLFYSQNENWFYTPFDHTFAYMLFIVYLTVSVLVMYFVLIGWYYSAENNRQRIQAIIMLAALSIFFVISLLTNLILPVIQMDIVPALAPVNALALIGGMFLTLMLQPKVYIAPELIYNLIHLYVKEFVFMLDKDIKIFLGNQYSLNQLKYSQYDFQKKDPYLFFSDFNKVIQTIHKMKRRDDSPQIRMDLITSESKSIPVLLSVIKVRNSYQKVEGYALVCTNYRQKLQLK